MVRVNRSGRGRRPEDKGPLVNTMGGTAKKVSSAGITAGRVLQADGGGGSEWGLVGADNVDATIHTQAEANAHAALPSNDAHPAPESPFDMGGQEVENVGAPNAAGSAARQAETDAVQTNLDTHEAGQGTGVHGLGTMATRTQGTGGSQHRTNSQMDGRYAQKDRTPSNPARSTSTTYQAGSTPRFVSFVGAGNPDGTQLMMGATDGASDDEAEWDAVAGDVGSGNRPCAAIVPPNWFYRFVIPNGTLNGLLEVD